MTFKPKPYWWLAGLMVFGAIVVVGASKLIFQTSQLQQKTSTQVTTTSPTQVTVVTPTQAQEKTQPEVWATLTIKQSQTQTKLSLTPQTTFKPTALTLKLKLTPELDANSQTKVINSLILADFWTQSKFQLAVKHFNLKDKTLELALVKLSPHSPELKPNQTVDLLKLSLPSKTTITLVDQESLITNDQGKYGVIQLE